MTVVGLSVFLAAASAGSPADPDGSTRDRIARLEWDRADPRAGFATQIAGGATEVRVAGVRALGRLRRADALDPLLAWQDDPDPEVRRAVAQALGWTPGGGQALREWWSAGEPVPAIAAAVLVGLGRQGDVRDVRALAAALSGPGEIGAAAARALGSLSARGVEGAADVAGPALLDRLGAARRGPLPDPRLVEAIAWALQRGRIPIPGARAAEVLAAIDDGPSVEARAWLLRAVWPALTVPEREARFLEAMTDAPRLVQQAVLVSLGPEDASPEVLSAFLADSDGWVRQSAIDALGRLEGAEEVLERLVDELTDPDERARAIRALARPDPAKAADASLPTVERAAWVASLDDEETLLQWATSGGDGDADAAAVLRAAAATALAARPAITEGARRALLASTDPLVRQVGYDGAPVALVLGPLARETDPAASASGWKGVEAALDAEPAAKATKGAVGALRKGDPEVLAALAALKVADAATAARARRVAEALGFEAPSPVPPENPVPWPASVDEVHAIRSARVVTDQGEFVIALDGETAPLAVAAFASLADEGFFDGLVFHRVVPGFVAQTGCPRGDGYGGPGFSLPDEISELPFDVGAVGMAREEARDTGGSQWFVTLADQPHLVSEYTRFGAVVSGLHVVKRLRQGAVIASVEVERLP